MMQTWVNKARQSDMEQISPRSSGCFIPRACWQRYFTQLGATIENTSKFITLQHSPARVRTL